MNEKVDLLANLAQGVVPNFDNVMASGKELELKPLDEYWKTEKAQKMFTTNGEPDKKKFKAFYDNAVNVYNEYAKHEFDVNNIEGMVLDNPITKALGLQTVKNPATFSARNVNPFNQTKSAIAFDELSERETTLLEEISDNTFFYEKGKRVETGDKISGVVDWLFNLPKGNPLIAAQYEEDGVHVDPATGRMMKHSKGDPKIDPITLRPYAETLDGRDVTGKQFLKFGDNLTEEGTWINKIDYFDSDDKEKSIMGSIAKTATEIAPLFLPVVGSAYGYLYAGKQLLDAGAEIYKSFDYNTDVDDQKLANEIQGFLGQYKSGASEYAQENTFSFENFANLLSSVALELKSQIAIGKLPTQIAALSNPAKLTDKLSSAGRLEKFQETLNVLSDPKKLRDVLGKSYDNAAQLSRVTNLVYNTAIASKQIGDSFDEAGIRGTDKAIGMGVGLAGLASLFSLSPFDSWFLNSMSLDDLSVGIKKALKGYTKELDLVKQTGNSVEKAKKFKGFFDKVFNKLKVDPSKVKSIDPETTAGAALSEALEENTEVVFNEGIKTLFNTMQDLGYTKEKEKNFKELFGKNFWDEIALSTIAGAGAGAAFRIANPVDLQSATITEYIQNGYGDDVLKVNNKMHKKAELASDKLSIEKYDVTDKGIVFKPAQKGDVTLNDFVKSVIEKQVQDAELFLTKEGLDNAAISNLEKKIASNFNSSEVAKQFIPSIYINEKLDVGVREEINQFTRKLVDLNKQIQIAERQVTEGSGSPQALNRLKNEYNKVKKEVNEIVAATSEDNEKTDFYVRRSLFSVLGSISSGFGVKNREYFYNKHKVNEATTKEEADERTEEANNEYKNYIENEKVFDVRQGLIDFENYEKTNPFAKYLQPTDEESISPSKVKDLIEKQKFRTFIDTLSNNFNFDLAKYYEEYESFLQQKEQLLELSESPTEEELTQAFEIESLYNNIKDPIIEKFIEFREGSTDTIFRDFRRFLTEKFDEDVDEYNTVFQETKDEIDYYSDQLVKYNKAIDEELLESLKKKTPENLEDLALREKDDNIEILPSFKRLVENTKISTDDLNKIISYYNKHKDSIENPSTYLEAVSDADESFLENLLYDVENDQDIFKTPKTKEQVEKEVEELEIDEDSKKLIDTVKAVTNKKANTLNSLATLDVFEGIVVDPKSPLAGTNIPKRIRELQELSKDPTKFVDLAGDMEKELEAMDKNLDKHLSYLLSTVFYNPVINDYRAKTELKPKTVLSNDVNEAIYYSEPLKTEIIRFKQITSILKNQLQQNKKFQLDNLLKQTSENIKEIVNSFVEFADPSIEGELKNIYNDISLIKDYKNQTEMFDLLYKAAELFKENANVTKLNNTVSYKKAVIDNEEILNPKYSKAMQYIIANSFYRATNINDIIAGVKYLAKESDFSSLGTQDVVLYQIFSFLQNTSNPAHDKADTGLLKLSNSINVDQPAGFGKTSTAIRGAAMFENYLNPNSEIWYSSIGENQLNALDKSISGLAKNKGTFTKLIQTLGGIEKKRTPDSKQVDKLITYEANVDADQIHVDEQKAKDLSNVSLIIIDEATRLNLDQIALIDELVKAHNSFRDNTPLRVMYAGDMEQISQITKVKHEGGTELIDEGFSTDHIDVETTPVFNIGFRNQYKYVPNITNQLRKIGKKITNPSLTDNNNESIKNTIASEKFEFEYFEGEVDGKYDFIGAYKASSDDDLGDKINKISELEGKKVIISTADKDTLTSKYNLKDGVFEIKTPFEIVKDIDSQGGEWDYVVIDDISTYDSDYSLLYTNKLLYTLFTRSKKTLLLKDFSNYKIGEGILLKDVYNFGKNKKSDALYPEMIQTLERNEDESKDVILQLRNIKLEGLKNFEFSKKPIQKQQPQKSKGKKSTKVKDIEINNFVISTEFEFVGNREFENEDRVKILDWFNTGQGAAVDKVTLEMYDADSADIQLENGLSYTEYVESQINKGFTMPEEANINPIALIAYVGGKKFKVGLVKLSKFSKTLTQGQKDMLSFKQEIQNNHVSGSSSVIAEYNSFEDFKKVGYTNLSFNKTTEIKSYDEFINRYKGRFNTSAPLIITTDIEDANEKYNQKGNIAVIVSPNPIPDDLAKQGEMIQQKLSGNSTDNSYTVIVFDKKAHALPEFKQKIDDLIANYKSRKGEGKYKKFWEYYKKSFEPFIKHPRTSVQLKILFAIAAAKGGISLDLEIAKNPATKESITLKNYIDEELVERVKEMYENGETTKDIVSLLSNEKVENAFGLLDYTISTKNMSTVIGNLIVGQNTNIDVNEINKLIQYLDIADLPTTTKSTKKDLLEAFLSVLEYSKDGILTSNFPLKQTKQEYRGSDVVAEAATDNYENLYTDKVVKRSLVVEPTKVIKFKAEQEQKKLDKITEETVNNIKSNIPTEGLKNKIASISNRSGNDASKFLTLFNDEVQGFYNVGNKPQFIFLKGSDWSDFSLSSLSLNKKMEITDEIKPFINNLSSLPEGANIKDNGVIDNTGDKIITYSINNKKMNIQVSQSEQGTINNIKKILGADFNSDLESLLIKINEAAKTGSPDFDIFTQDFLESIIDVVSETKYNQIENQLINCRL